MNVDLTQLQDLLTQFFTAVKSGNIAAIAVVVLSAWALYKKWRQQPPVAPVTPTGQKTIDAALHLLNASPATPAEKALVAAVADKHGE